MPVVTAESLSTELEWVAQRIADLPLEHPHELQTAFQWVVAVIASLSRLELIDIEHAHALNDEVHRGFSLPSPRMPWSEASWLGGSKVVTQGVWADTGKPSPRERLNWSRRIRALAPAQLPQSVGQQAHPAFPDRHPR